MRGSALANVVQRADVRVGEGGDGAGLALEARAALGVVAQFSRENLDRDRAIEARVAGLVDFAHPPGADQPEDLVGAKARARSQGHDCS